MGLRKQGAERHRCQQAKDLAVSFEKWIYLERHD